MAIAIGAVCACQGCWPSSPEPPPINVASGLQAVYLVTEAESPYALAAAADGRVFYTEKDTGQIRVIKGGVCLERPFATVPVNFAGDRGLLGIALHPDFKLNGRVYVFYSRSDTGQATDDPQAIVDHRVVYFEADPNDPDVSRTPEIFVLSLAAGTSTTRIGGRIAFGSDRTLLVAFGDLGQDDAGQRNELLSGKILRYNDDGTIPDDNPAAGPVYARGLRQPRGLALDPDSGYAFLIEESRDGVHEINRIRGGGNYGWPTIIGLADTAGEIEAAAQIPSYIDPIEESDQALIGATFNPAGKYGPDAQLDLFYAIADRGRVNRVELSADRTAVVATRLFAAGLPTPVTDLVFTPAGSLYVACRSAILRIDVVR